MTQFSRNPRERLVFHIQELERLESLKKQAADDLKTGFEDAKANGYDATTLKVVLKLRKMTPDQRRERRALEAIYLAALGMLEGDPLTDEARRRLDGQPPAVYAPSAPPSPSGESEPPLPLDAAAPGTEPEPPAVQVPLIVKDPAEARTEGEAAGAAGKRIYDNPYRAGDPCRAAWDEGWCSQQNSHGLETPAAYQRRSTKPPEPTPDPKPDPKPGAGDDATGDGQR